MADRYAVATGNWSGAIWAATVGGVAGSAATPTAADAATINASRTVTLDGASLACLTLAINGTLNGSTSVAWDITCEQNITINSGGAIDIDMSAASVAGIINLNGADATGNGYHLVADNGGTFKVKGKLKNRLASLASAMSASATSATVDDATGWEIGDLIILGASEGYNATPKIDIVTLTSVNTGTGAIR